MTRLLKVSFAILTLSFALTGTGFSSEEETFPTAGFIKNDDSNVRAGDNINFETLCSLKKGDTVTIIGKRYSWLKIELPENARAYIRSDFVEITKDEETGMVNAQRVNLRAGPATKYSILGQVSEPEKLTIIAENDGWYEIKPPKEASGWIHSSQVTFDAVTIPEKTNASLPSPEPKTKIKSSGNITLKAGAAKPKGNLTFSTKSDQ